MSQREVTFETAFGAPPAPPLANVGPGPLGDGKSARAARVHRVVIDAYSRRVVGWSVDSTQTTVLVTNALGMATRRRDPNAGLVIHADR